MYQDHGLTTPHHDTLDTNNRAVRVLSYSWIQYNPPSTKWPNNIIRIGPSRPLIIVNDMGEPKKKNLRGAKTTHQIYKNIKYWK